MFSRSKKMMAMVLPPLDSGPSSDSESEVDELNLTEIDNLLLNFDEELENEVSIFFIILKYYHLICIYNVCVLYYCFIKYKIIILGMESKNYRGI